VMFVEEFVDSMPYVMGWRIREHLHAVDYVTSRKHLFAFAADTVTDVHKTGDAIVMLIMTKEREEKSIFIDYLLVTQHTGHALMREIYEEKFVKKLGLTPHDIRQQCTGPAFYGQHFSLYALEAFAKIMIERTKESTAAVRETAKLLEWLLCTCDPAHRLAGACRQRHTRGSSRCQRGVDVRHMVCPNTKGQSRDVCVLQF
jgi:hypothetical protein